MKITLRLKDGVRATPEIIEKYEQKYQMKMKKIKSYKNHDTIILSDDN